MAWTNTNPVSVGDATKKNDWDKLWDNADFVYTFLNDASLTSGQVVVGAGTGPLTVGNVPMPKNLLINGCMRHAQRGASGSATFDATTAPLNSDDTYLLDRWILLSDGNDACDVTQQTLGGVSGQEAYVRLDVETVQKKFGLLQIIENKSCKGIIGSTASLSMELKVTNATKLSDIRAAVFSWDNGIDTPTSDLVSAWEAQGTVITPIANWTAESVAVDLNVTTSWVRYKIENISIDSAGADNVAVFIYQNNVAANDTAGIFLEIANVQLEKGAIATAFEYRDVGLELGLNQRYYTKSYLQTVVPGTATAVGRHQWRNSAATSADHTLVISPTFPAAMRVAPTVTLYDAAGTSGKVTMAAGDNLAGTAANISNLLVVVSGTNGAAATNRLIAVQLTAESEL